MTDRQSVARTKGAAPPDPLVGRVISERFRVTGLLARGGMGKVYRAEQAPLGRVCAIKVLNASYAGEHDPEFHKRFFLEASIASKLTHPNTVTIFDYGRTDDDVYYMAMEYLDGRTLHRAIREAGHLPEERATHIARQICRALREAHSMGVIHRDLKPANVFLVEHGDEADFVKVLDFGLVKIVADTEGAEDLTQTGLFMGSPKYMAPEQIRGDRVDARTDIYALGIVLYEMMTGKVPFDRANSVNVLMAHVNEEPPDIREMNPRITVSPALRETIARCMAKDPARRFDSMNDVLTALKNVGGRAASTSGVDMTDGQARSASGTPVPERSDGRSSRAFRSTSKSDSGSIQSPLTMPSDSPGRGAPFLLPLSGKNGSKAILIAAVAGALATAATVGYVASHSSGSSVARPDPLKATGEIAAPVVASSVKDVSSAAPSAAAFATLRVNSDPDGASVREDGVELCNSTPCEILYRGTAAEPGQDHKLTIARQGYRNETRSVKVGDPPVTVKLSVVAAGPRAMPQPPSKIDTPSVPTGYKTDIPY